MYLDDTEFNSIKNHAGWVLQRAWETTSKGDSLSLKALQVVEGSNIVHGDRNKALDLISSLGSDAQQDDGNFHFVLFDHVVPFSAQSFKNHDESWYYDK